MNRRMLGLGSLAAAFTPLLPKPAKAKPPTMRLLSFIQDVPDGTSMDELSRMVDEFSSAFTKVRDEKFPAMGRRRNMVRTEFEDLP